MTEFTHSEDVQLTRDWLIKQLAQCNNVRMHFKSYPIRGHSTRMKSLQFKFTEVRDPTLGAQPQQWMFNVPKLDWMDKLAEACPAHMLLIWCRMRALQLETDSRHWTKGTLFNLSIENPELSYKQFNRVRKATGFDPRKMLELWGADTEVLEAYCVWEVTEKMLGIEI